VERNARTTGNPRDRAWTVVAVLCAKLHVLVLASRKLTARTVEAALCVEEIVPTLEG
jgi:hypothetical protein